MVKLKEFPSYGFLNIFGVKYRESVKYGRREFSYYRKNIGKHKLFHIFVSLRYLGEGKWLQFPKHVESKTS